LILPDDAQISDDLMTVAEASRWASEYIKKNVTPSNITYLVQYGRVRKHGTGSVTRVSKAELIAYYQSYLGTRERDWKSELGDHINWSLSFDYLKEADTTKHVHRLHPYKGKFIPQLVEYFIDTHTDEFKQDVYFRPGDTLLDPFCGSGTTLVQANESGMNAIGIDISEFNVLIANTKVMKHDLVELQRHFLEITHALKIHLADSPVPKFDEQLTAELAAFNNAYFPSHEFKYKVRQKLIDQDVYGQERAEKFLLRYFQLVNQHHITVWQDKTETFLDKWYLFPIRQEIDLVQKYVHEIENPAVRQAIQVVLSRTVRTCRATTHADLATLIDPVTSTYYCAKHGKVCKPLFSMLGWWERYTQDTLQRLAQFHKLRTQTEQISLVGDARNLPVFDALRNQKPEFAAQVEQRKIQGIFSSPPYVGLIDYHEQHAYAYELFGFPRQDEKEIGAMFRGQSKSAKEDYAQGIADVLTNCKQFLADDYDVFLVANDKYGLYPSIAAKAGMTIVNEFHRPVLNRTEKDKTAYSETIFHLQAE
jgi:glutaredoxin-related protein